MPFSDPVIAEAARIFDALSDPTRFQILALLAQGERGVSDLVEATQASQSSISHHLRLLRDRVLVSARREGQRQIYALADDHVATLIEVGIAHASELHPESEGSE